MMFAFRADVEMLLQHGPGMDRGAAGTFGGSGTQDFAPDHLILPRGGCCIVDVREPKARIQVWQVFCLCFHEYSVTVTTKLLSHGARCDPVPTVLPGKLTCFIFRSMRTDGRIPLGG